MKIKYKRLDLPEDKLRKIRNTEDIYYILAGYIRREMRTMSDVDHFWLLGLDREDYILTCDTISDYDIDEMEIDIVNPISAYRHLIYKNVTYAIIVHSYIDGNLKPTKEMINITDIFHKCGQVLDIELIDNLVISIDGYFSFKEGNIMDEKIKKSKKNLPSKKQRQEWIDEKAEILRTAYRDGMSNGRLEREAEIVSNCLRDGMPISQIIKITKLSEEEIKKHKEYKKYEEKAVHYIVENMEDVQNNEKLEIAKNMKAENIDINTIAKITGFTKEIIEKL